MAELRVHICPIKDAACVELDDAEKCHSCPSLQLAPQNQSAAEWLLPEDMQALERFCETCEDNQPYDVPKDRMRRLAELGVIQWCGGARYSVTAFGQHVLDLLPDGWPRLPLKTQADHDADVKAEIDRNAGVRVGAPRKATNAEIAEWAERHDLSGGATDLRSAFEDAESHHLTRGVKAWREPISQDPATQAQAAAVMLARGVKGSGNAA